jgi:cell division protein FtsW (lipid II flippase)
MRSDFWRHFDFLLLGAVILANAFGVAMIRSAIAGNEVLAGLVNRQIIFAALGLVLIFAFAVIDYHYWAATIRPIYLLTMLFLLVLFVVGQVTFGAVRWIETDWFPFSPPRSRRSS